MTEHTEQTARGASGEHLVSPEPDFVETRLAVYAQDEHDEIFGGVTDPFGVADVGLTWQPKKEHFGIRWGDRLVAHTGLLRLPVEVGGVATEVIGIGGVAVAPDVRGRGLARRVVAVALEHARTMGPEYALLFCRPPLVALYERLGWRPVDAAAGDVLVPQPENRTVVMPLHTMLRPLHDGARWPQGQLRLLDLPM
ncbi:GNAT family N-acetyltransferase [Streptomyces sp. NPDC050504]|uniref:GNAT family N-acetyltransferase n=1 Tax=Streptomyces sp. NPDC050504 TaxID=3365618 RepID=UPI00378AA091